MELKHLKDVLYLTYDELARSYQWYDGVENLNNSVQVLSLDDLPKLQKRGYDFFIKQMEVGSVLIRNPFNQRQYIDINESEDRIIREKISAMSMIAQKLGARKIIGTAEFLEEQKLERTTDGSAKYKAVTLDVEYRKQQQEKCQKKYKLIREFNGAFSAESYQEAIDLLKKYNLTFDPEVRDLVGLRNPSERNILGKQSVHMNLSREVNSSKEIAASLTVLGDDFSLGFSTKESISTLKSMIFDTEIDF